MDNTHTDKSIDTILHTASSYVPQVQLNECLIVIPK
jgi:hypothetical protein